MKCLLYALILLAAAPVLGAVVTVGTEDHQAVEVAVRETVTLRVPSTAGTGYTWRVDEINKAHLTVIGHPTYEAAKTPALGGSGYQIFRFRPRKPGVTRVTLHYARPWETNVKPSRHLTLEITVRPRSSTKK